VYGKSILAFFQVVASSQICPLTTSRCVIVYFRLQNYEIIPALQNNAKISHLPVDSAYKRFFHNIMDAFTKKS